MKPKNVIPKLVNTSPMTIKEIVQKEGVYVCTNNRGYEKGRFVVIIGGTINNTVLYVDDYSIVIINVDGDGWINSAFVRVRESVSMIFT